MGDELELPEGPVTVMFTDIEGSTALRTSLGDLDDGLVEADLAVASEPLSGFSGIAAGFRFLVTHGLDAVRESTAPPAPGSSSGTSPSRDSCSLRG